MQTTPYQAFSIAFAILTAILATWFLYTRVFPSCRKSTDKKVVLTRQKWYRALSIIFLTLAELTSIMEIVIHEMMTKEESKRWLNRYDDSIIHFFVVTFLHLGYIFYTLIMLHRYDRLIGSLANRQTRASCLHRICNTQLFRYKTYFVNLVLSVLVLGQVFIKAIHSIDTRDAPDSTHAGWILYSIFFLLESLFSVIVPILAISIEAFVNYKLITHTLKYQTEWTRLEENKRTLEMNLQLKRRMFTFLGLFIATDVSILVLFVFGVLGIIPFYATATIADSWLIYHVIFAFRLLDLLVQELKRLPRAIAAARQNKTDNQGNPSTQDCGFQYASRTDIVQEGLMQMGSTVGPGSGTNAYESDS